MLRPPIRLTINVLVMLLAGTGGAVRAQNPTQTLTGIVREGMLADMVIVDPNPLQNFKTLYANGTLRLNDKSGKVERVGRIKWTIKDGIAYDAKKLAADVQAMVEKQKRTPKKTTTAAQSAVAGSR